jgi:hypothetical protein
MTGRRGTAVATGLLCAALAAAGCGLGPGAEVGSVELTVTREFGAVPMLDRSVQARESDTVMRLLESSADVQTRYGGGFVHAIEGVAEEQRDGDPYDWFFYVDGEESPVGAADVDLEGGERVWWDYRNWSATDHVPAVVGSWPAPFAQGVEGRRYAVLVGCAAPPATCEATSSALEGVGAETETVQVPPGEAVQSATAGPAIRVLVGTWDRLRADPAARLIEAGPGESGVFADFETTGDGYEIVALDETGTRARRLGTEAGLVAATSRYGGPPIWLVTGGTPAAVRAAAAALDEEQLRDRYAVALVDGKATPLPVEGR